MNTAVLPEVGFDKVKFGMTRDEVIAAIGKPDEISENENYGDGELATIFYYDNPMISLSFDKEEGYRLVEISFDDETFTLADKIRVGMPIEEVLDIVDTLGYGECYEEDLEDELDEEQKVSDLRLFVYEDKNLSLWSMSGRLSTIQIGPAFVDDDTIEWPG